MKLERAKIIKVHWGIYFGHLTSYIELETKLGVISYGGFSLDGDRASAWVKKLLSITYVEDGSPTKFEGQWVRMKIVNYEGGNERIIALGHIDNDVWLDKNF